MKKYNIRINLIRVIKYFYGKATTAVLLNGSAGDHVSTLTHPLKYISGNDHVQTP